MPILKSYKMIRLLLNSFALVFFLSHGWVFSFLLLPAKPVSSSIICKKLPTQQILSELEDALENLKTRLKVGHYSTTPVLSSSVTDTSNIFIFICQHCKLYEFLKD